MFRLAQNDSLLVDVAAGGRGSGNNLKGKPVAALRSVSMAPTNRAATRAKITPNTILFGHSWERGLNWLRISEAVAKRAVGWSRTALIILFFRAPGISASDFAMKSPSPEFFP